ncbi:MAG: methionine--tRNA ligase [Candidatus Gottesmanbacteria bacterium]
MTKKFYLTIAIPYVNGSPHAGHALEFIQGDTIARYHKLLKEDVFFVSGSDENGLKIVQAAEKENITPQELADRNTKVFQECAKVLNVSLNEWRRGSDKKYHWPGSKKLWQLCEKNGDIYKKRYGGFYCVGCEEFYTEKELIEGKCPEHLTKPEWVEEENYFFKLSKYQKQIGDLINSNKLLIIPETRRNEVLSFIKSGLQDFSISRSKKRAKNWGIPVPNDETQIIYTWFDALNIYQTAVGFGYDESLWKKWWPADLHVIGKGIIRFHAVYWIGMLLSAGFSLPKSIFVHGYISSSGHKMSKSLGNVINPFEIVKKYGTDATRYYLLREIPAYSDGDFSENRFKELYNADLANGLGNLVARVAKLASKGVTFQGYEFNNYKIYTKALAEFRFNDALVFIWGKVTLANKAIDETQPWNLQGEKLEKFLYKIIVDILEIAFLLKPFLPQTADKIFNQFSKAKVIIEKPLFPRL